MAANERRLGWQGPNVLILLSTYHTASPHGSFPVRTTSEEIKHDLRQAGFPGTDWKVEAIRGDRIKITAHNEALKLWLMMNFPGIP